MPTVTVSSKNQITLPAQIVRAMGIQPGQKLVLDLVDGRIVALLEPASWADYMQGAGRGVYGTTNVAVDRYVAEERATWGPEKTQDDVEDFADYYAACQGGPAGQVIDVLAAARWLVGLTEEEIVAETGLVGDQVRQTVSNELEPRGWVRRVDVVGARPRYRLRRDLAEAVKNR